MENFSSPEVAAFPGESTWSETRMQSDVKIAAVLLRWKDQQWKPAFRLQFQRRLRKILVQRNYVSAIDALSAAEFFELDQ
jgi:hypothetical protein